MPVTDDGDERKMVQEIVCRFQGVLSAVLGDPYDPLGFTGLALHDVHSFPPDRRPSVAEKSEM
jgi:hypothetical protein